MGYGKYPPGSNLGQIWVCEIGLLNSGSIVAGRGCLHMKVSCCTFLVLSPTMRLVLGFSLSRGVVWYWLFKKATDRHDCGWGLWVMCGW